MIKRKVKRKSPNRSAKRVMTRQMQYEDPRWKSKRVEIFIRDGYKCQDPNCPGLTTELHCHHKMYPSGKKLWEVSDDLLITLCTHCHSKIHGHFLGRKKVSKHEKE